MAKDWWDPSGKFKSLHLFNPARIAFIREKLISHFKLNSSSSKPLKELKILDIGCGGGLLCEPLNRLGATVTGIDPSSSNIEVAKLHSKEMNLNIKTVFPKKDPSEVAKIIYKKFNSLDGKYYIPFYWSIINKLLNLIPQNIKVKIIEKLNI